MYFFYPSREKSVCDMLQLYVRYSALETVFKSKSGILAGKFAYKKSVDYRL